MANETSVRIYIRGKSPKKRLQNIKALALKYFPKPGGGGNISALFHDALRKVYGLDEKTSAPLEALPTMVSDKLAKPLAKSKKKA